MAQLLSLDQVAQKLDFPVNFVQYLIFRGDFPSAIAGEWEAAIIEQWKKQ